MSEPRKINTQDLLNMLNEYDRYREAVPDDKVSQIKREPTFVRYKDENNRPVIWWPDEPF
mgnify:CR=1 FL=1